jgi:hypothetical protein
MYRCRLYPKLSSLYKSKGSPLVEELVVHYESDERKPPLVNEASQQAVLSRAGYPGIAYTLSATVINTVYSPLQGASLVSSSPKSLDSKYDAPLCYAVNAMQLVAVQCTSPKERHGISPNQTNTPLLIPLQAQNQSPQATQTLTAIAQNVGK